MSSRGDKWNENVTKRCPLTSRRFLFRLALRASHLPQRGRFFLFRHGCRRATFPKGEGYGVGFLHFTVPRPSPILGPRQSPAKRVCWGEEEQGSGGRATKGSPNRSGLCDDEKVSPEATDEGDRTAGAPEATDEGDKDFPGVDTTSVAQKAVEFIPILSHFCPGFVAILSHFCPTSEQSPLLFGLPLFLPLPPSPRAPSPQGEGLGCGGFITFPFGEDGLPEGQDG